MLSREASCSDGSGRLLAGRATLMAPSRIQLRDRLVGGRDWFCGGGGGVAVACLIAAVGTGLATLSRLGHRFRSVRAEVGWARTLAVQSPAGNFELVAGLSLPEDAFT